MFRALLLIAAGVSAASASLKVEGPTTGSAGLEGEACPVKVYERYKKVVGEIEEECKCADTICELKWCQKTDVDKDGYINAAEFHGLCEDIAALPRRFVLAPGWDLCVDIAALPRRFGLAPGWEKEHGTKERRTPSRKAMFGMLDLRPGPPRGWIGLEQFVNWATDHLITKVATSDIAADVNYYHREQYCEHQYLTHLEQAVTDPASRAHASLYEFLFAVFTECDSRSTGILEGFRRPP